MPISRRCWLRFDGWSFLRPPCPQRAGHQWRHVLPFYPACRGVYGEPPWVVHFCTCLDSYYQPLVAGLGPVRGRWAHGARRHAMLTLVMLVWTYNDPLRSSPHPDLALPSPDSLHQIHELVRPISTPNLRHPYSTSWRRLVSTTTPT